MVESLIPSLLPDLLVCRDAPRRENLTRCFLWRSGQELVREPVWFIGKPFENKAERRIKIENRLPLLKSQHDIQYLCRTHGIEVICRDGDRPSGFEALGHE